ncbi:Zinc finger BED domain-containing protein 4 [Mycena venus]|uniref:Zinc finger BED domain-containing protein 4 n=1 Tax=Mycena venus TaxID=2733690 RepID=A0A8H7DFB6_9AGAR|nr:Zinc finger BED domain-containing protein 4 [Mycena venus]
MPPRRAQKNTDQEAAPSSEPAGGRVTRRSANQPQATAPPDPRQTPAQAASARGQARNYAPLASAYPGRGTGSSQSSNQNLNPIPEISTPATSSRLRFPPSTPVTVLPSRVQTLPQTPARVVASQLVEQLGPQSAMASPGPRLRDPGNDDSESEGAEEFDLQSGSDSDAPPIYHPPATRHTAAESPAFISLNSDDEGSPPPIRAGRRGRGRRRGGSAHQDRGSSDTADLPSIPPVQPQPRQPQARTGTEGHTVDDQNFAWAEESVLQTASTPEMKYFFGRHTQSKTWKCRVCSRVYASGTSVSSRRKHLEGQHLDEYLDAIHQHTWARKPSADHEKQLEERRTNYQRVPYSTAALANQLVRVVVSNDLSINLIENRDFRDLLLFLRETLRDADIPHRTKLRSLIIDAWLDYWEELKAELRLSLGRISFTGDIWSSAALHPYLAITAHWFGRRLDTNQVLLRQALLAFRRIRGAHSGQRIARVVFDVMDQAEILGKIGHFTLDNASNNLSFMTHFSILLRRRDINGFDAKNNYIRCFAHIINLCSQAVIRAMEKDDTDADYPDTDTEPGTDSDISDDDGVTIRPTRTSRKAGPIQRARKSVRFIRKSGQRRDQFLEIIQQGNDDKTWTQVVIVDAQAEKVTVNLALVTLFPDVKKRWDSVFFHAAETALFTTGWSLDFTLTVSSTNNLFSL